MVQMKPLIIYCVTAGRSKFAFYFATRQKLSSVLEETQLIYMKLQLCIPWIPIRPFLSIYVIHCYSMLASLL